MRYGIQVKDGDAFEFVGEMTFSIGDGLDLDTRFGHDASKRPQSLTRRRKNTAKTGSLNIVLNRVAAPDLFKEIEKYERAAGVIGELYWNGENLGLWCVKDVSFSLAIDAIDIVSGLQVSLNLAEGYVSKPHTHVEVRLT